MKKQNYHLFLNIKKKRFQILKKSKFQRYLGSMIDKLIRVNKENFIRDINHR